MCWTNSVSMNDIFWECLYDLGVVWKLSCECNFFLKYLKDLHGCCLKGAVHWPKIPQAWCYVLTLAAYLSLADLVNMKVKHARSVLCQVHFWNAAMVWCSSEIWKLWFIKYIKIFSLKLRMSHDRRKTRQQQSLHGMTRTRGAHGGWGGRLK